MKRKRKRFLGIGMALLMVGLFVACGKKSQTAVIELDSNPTTGYQWYITEDMGILDITSQYQEGENNGDTVGGGGKTVLTITPKEPGTTEVLLKYCQEWEESEDDIRYAYQVVVNKDMTMNITNLSENENAPEPKLN